MPCGLAAILVLYFCPYNFLGTNAVNQRPTVDKGKVNRNVIFIFSHILVPRDNHVVIKVCN